MSGLRLGRNRVGEDRQEVVAAVLLLGGSNQRERRVRIDNQRCGETRQEEPIEHGKKTKDHPTNHFTSLSRTSNPHNYNTVILKPKSTVTLRLDLDNKSSQID